MTADPFTDRLTRVRDRFAASLAGKIEGVCAAVSNFSDGDAGAAAAVEEAYRFVHGMVGVGPTVGFPATGSAAHEVENVLRGARTERRGLTSGEISLLARTLETLRETAARELKSFHSVQR